MSTNQTGEVDEFGPLREAFATTLRVEMARAGLDQKALAAKSGISVGTISNYWHGRTVPRLIEMSVLSRALDMKSRVFYDRIMDEYDRARHS